MHKPISTACQVLHRSTAPSHQQPHSCIYVLWLLLSGQYSSRPLPSNCIRCRLVVAMSRARLGLYVFAKAQLFADCYELAPSMKLLMARPQAPALLPQEYHGVRGPSSTLLQLLHSGSSAYGAFIRLPIYQQGQAACSSATSSGELGIRPSG